MLITPHSPSNDTF